MSFPRSRTDLIVVTGVAALVFFVAVASCSSSRFNEPDATVCTACHQVFAEPAEYMPMGETSKSVEDLNPSVLFEPKLFDMSAGCGECHAYPFEEYKDSPHYDNDMGVRPGCVGCHEPHGLWEFLRFKFLYINDGRIGKSPFDSVSISLVDISELEKLRIRQAATVRQQMIAEQSKKCMVCHKIDSEIWGEIKRHKAAREQMEKGEKSCIHCHYNLVHADVDWPEMEGE